MKGRIKATIHCTVITQCKGAYTWLACVTNYWLLFQLPSGEMIHAPYKSHAILTKLECASHHNPQTTTVVFYSFSTPSSFISRPYNPHHCPISYWSGDHVWPLRASCLDSLEDVHFTLHFDPLNLSHGSDKHTSAGHAITV